MAKNMLATGGAGLRRVSDRQASVTNAPQYEAPLARRLRARRWYAPAMTLVTLLGMVALIVTAAIGARATAEAAAQQRLAQAARMANALLTTNGASLSVDDNDQLVATSNNSPIILARDASIVNRLSALTGAAVALYQVKGGELIGVAASAGIPTVRGATLTNSTHATLSKHQQFTGPALLGAQMYETSAAPLFDQTGLFVGAVVAATPMDAIMAGPTQLTVMLSLVGLLLTLLALALGLWFTGVFGGQALAILNTRLATLGVAAAHVEDSIGAHSIRAQRQERIGRLLSDDLYHLATLANALGEHQHALQETVNGIWAGVSQPGGAPDAQTVLWLARQTAVNAARLGASAEEAESLCQQMTPLLNRLIGEDRALSESAAVTQRQASVLRQAVEQVEMTVGANLTPRPNRGLASLMERAQAVSQRLRQGTDTLTALRRPNTHPKSSSASGAPPSRLTPPISGKRLSGGPTRSGSPSHRRTPSTSSSPQPRMRGMPASSRPASASSPASPAPFSSWPTSQSRGISSWRFPTMPNASETNPHAASSGWWQRAPYEAADSPQEDDSDWLNE